MSIKKYQLFLWISVFPLILIVSFFLSWKALSSQNFLYEFWYDNTKLEKFIDFYAPLNRFKPEFSETSREERIRLFSETVKSINNHGEGLADISFYNPEGDFLGLLYQPAELEHLFLVSKLVNFLNVLAIVCMILLFIIITTLNYYKCYLKDIKYILASYSFLLTIPTLLIFIAKPVNVFSYLHETFFPEGHQWFFYYQDSLMTTLMMAPELFAYFSVIWITCSLLLNGLFIALLIKYFNTRFKYIDI
jgi:hypothetical protein